MSVICTIMLLRKRRGFAARKDFIPTVQHRAVCSRLPKHSGLSTPDPVWGQPNARARSPVPRAALAPTGVPRVQPGGSWRALSQATDTREHFITDFQVLSRTGRTTGLSLIVTRYPSGSERDATEETIFLLYVSGLSLNLSVTLAPPG